MSQKRKQEELKLTSSQMERLIELYQSEVDLWNISSSNYHKKDYRQKALQNMTDNLLSDYPSLQCNVEQIQTKLSYLRGYYSRELAKINKSLKSGSGSDEIYKSPWAHFNTLDAFLRHQISPRVSQSNLNSSQCGQQEDFDEDSENEETTSQCSDLSAEPLTLPEKKRKNSGPEAVMQQAISCLQDIKNRSQTKTSVIQEDEDTIFGKYVANELRKISDDRTKSLLKYKIQSAIFESQLGQTQQGYQYNTQHSYFQGHSSATQIGQHLMTSQSNSPQQSGADVGDHVVVINCRKVALAEDLWRTYKYFHHTGYKQGKSVITAWRMQDADPVQVLQKAVYRAGPKNLLRPNLMQRLHLYPDEDVPEDVIENVTDVIRQVQMVPKALDQYTQEEIDSFPKLFDWPEDHVLFKKKSFEQLLKEKEAQAKNK